MRAHYATYIQDETNHAQYQYQLYQCLMNSLKETARSKIVKEIHKYTIGDTRCGPTLCKFIISKAYIDTRATLPHIRENLDSLDVYMAKVSNNIIKFNEYVTERRLNLKARRGVTHDLLTKLWKLI